MKDTNAFEIDKCTILGIATHSETLEEMLVIQDETKRKILVINIASLDPSVDYKSQVDISSPVPEDGTRLKHHKGALYKVLWTAEDVAAAEEVYVYLSEKDQKNWIRPVSMFFEDVWYQEQWVKRFSKV